MILIWEAVTAAAIGIELITCLSPFCVSNDDLSKSISDDKFSWQLYGLYLIYSLPSEIMKLSNTGYFKRICSHTCEDTILTTFLSDLRQW